MKQRDISIQHSISSLNQQGKLEKHFTLNLAGNLDNSLLKRKYRNAYRNPREELPLPPKQNLHGLR